MKISRILCDFCQNPQILSMKHCLNCGAMYTDSKFNINDTSENISENKDQTDVFSWSKENTFNIF